MFVRVGADTTDLQRGMRDAENRVRSFGRATQSVNFDRLRGPMSALTAQLTGLNPAFGTLSSTLLSMTAGGGVAVAAIGGFAAIGAAIRSFTEDSRKAREEQEKLIETLNEAARRRIAASPGGMQDAIAKTRADLDAAIARRSEAQLDRAASEMAGPILPLTAFFTGRAVKDAEADVQKLSRALYEQTRAFDQTWQAAQKLDGILLSVGESAKTVQERLGGFGFGGGLNATAEAARAAVQGGGGSTEPPWLRKLTASINAGTVARTGVGGGALDNAVRTFEGAVDDFGSGVKEMVSGVFSSQGLANIGQGLAQQGIGFLAGKAIEKVGTLFTTGAEKIAAAMEQNTRAQRATAEFLSERLTGSELTDEAQAIARVLQDTINEIAVGGPNEILGIFKALREAGISLETFHAVAKQLGIDSKALSLETLQQFLDQINKAGAGVDSLADATERATEALNNVPEIWNAALGRFRSTRTAAGNLAMPGGGGNVFNVTFPNVRNGQQAYQEMEREATRRSARGGAPVIIDSTRRPRQ